MPNRHRLPDRRATYTFPVNFTNGSGVTFAFIASVGVFDDGGVAEVFLESSKAASDVHSMAADAAIMFSIAMQYGTPLEVIRASMSRNSDGTPQSLFGALVDAIDREMVVA